MSIKVMVQVWNSSTTKGSERLVLLALADAANDDGVCWPSIQTIATKANLSRRYVLDILNRLTEYGLVEKDHQYQGGKYTSNLYRIALKPALDSEADSTMGSEADSTMGSEARSTTVVRPASLGSEARLTRGSEARLTGVVRPASLKSSFNHHIEPSVNHHLNPEDDGEIFQDYENNIGVITPHIADSLKEAEQVYPKAWILKAIEIAAGNNARRWAYIKKVLSNWKTNGFDWKPGDEIKSSKPTEPAGYAALREYAETEGIKFDAEP